MTTPALPSGTRIGDFVVDALIGVGGMGRVYRAHQEGVDRPVALKILTPMLASDPGFVGRFRREAGMMRDLEHPAVLAVYAAGEDAGHVYLATRLVLGSTLAQLLADTRLRPGHALDILRPIGDGLDHAHSRGVIHRDVKPANILVDTDGRPFLADFGISKELGVAATRSGQVLGTPRYMAPEQAGGDGAVGHRADLYSLACVAFEMLTGSVPYTESDTVPLLLAHASRPVPRASAVDPSLPTRVDGVFARGLAKRPGDRFPSARAFVDELTTALDGTRRHVGATRSTWRPVLVGTGMVALVAVVALLVGVGATRTGAAPPADPAPSPSAAPTAAADTAAFRPASAALADVPRGELTFEAAMDGTPAGFVVSPATEADSAREAIRYVPGALELEIYVGGGETYSELAVDSGVETFLGEIDLSVRPGSDVELCWSLRWAIPRQLAGFLCVDTASGSTGFSVYRRGEGKAPIGDPVTVDLSGGRTVRLAVLVGERQLSLYADGQRVIDVPNDVVPVAGTLPGIELESTTGTGLVRIEGLRIYELGTTA